MTTNDTRIRTIFYFATGREQSAHDCDSVQAAFDRCARMNMDANVHPVGTTKGVYVWRPGVNNTIESLTDKLEDIVIDNYGCSRNVARIRLGATMLAPDGMTVWPWDERVMEVSKCDEEARRTKEVENFRAESLANYEQEYAASRRPDDDDPFA